MDDEADITRGTYREESLVSSTVQPMKRKPRRRRIQLKIESRGFNRFLFGGRQFAKAFCEGVGDTELHYGSAYSVAVVAWCDNGGSFADGTRRE